MGEKVFVKINKKFKWKIWKIYKNTNSARGVSARADKKPCALLSRSRERGETQPVLLAVTGATPKSKSLLTSALLSLWTYYSTRLPSCQVLFWRNLWVSLRLVPNTPSGLVHIYIPRNGATARSRTLSSWSNATLVGLAVLASAMLPSFVSWLYHTFGD